MDGPRPIAVVQLQTMPCSTAQVCSRQHVGAGMLPGDGHITAASRAFQRAAGDFGHGLTSSGQDRTDRIEDMVLGTVHCLIIKISKIRASDSHRQRPGRPSAGRPRLVNRWFHMRSEYIRDPNRGIRI